MRHPLTQTLSQRPPWEPGGLTRVTVRISGEVRAISETINPLERRWHELTDSALDHHGEANLPIWVVLGDSTSQGVGASSINHSWVARVAAALEAIGRPHHVVNLSRSGARSSHVRHEQLPMIDLLPATPELITLTVGTNDLLRNPHAPAAARRLSALIEDLPTGSIAATLPSPSYSPSAAVVNRSIRKAAEDAGHKVAELGKHLLPPHRGLARDRFHPNDLGYRAWVRAFAATLGVDTESIPDVGHLDDNADTDADADADTSDLTEF